MKELYKALYDETNTTYRYNKKAVSLGELSHFVAMKGPEYDQQEVRLFVIGRAVNGWMALPCSDAGAFSEEADRVFHSKGFAWVVNDETGLHNEPGEGENTYYLSGSAFWRVTHRVWLNLSKSDSARWVDNIAWSNLYKIAPPITGNPILTMCKKQLKQCRAILKREIEEYKPTHILLVTGWQWWFHDETCGFSELFTNCIHRGNCSDDPSIFVEGTAVFTLPDGATIPAVIASRPEQRSEDEFVRQVLDAFK